MCKVTNHENHVRWIYLTSVLCMGGGGVRSMREYDNSIKLIYICIMIRNNLCDIITIYIRYIL